MKPFWYHRPDEDFPPRAVLRPDEWQPSDRLRVVCTQTRLPAAEQRRLVREWCELLPKLGSVRFLWLSSRAPQALFDAACRVPGLEGLWVKWSGVRNVAALREASSLRFFHLGSSSSLASIEPIADRTGLRWLGLENLKKIDDLGPLGGLADLEGLSIEGSLWSVQRVATLRPLGGLRDLRYLSLANLRADDGTLSPLFVLEKLETFRAATWWPEDELRELRRRNPALIEDPGGGKD